MTAGLVIVLVDRSEMSVNLYFHSVIEAMDCADMYSCPIAYGLPKYSKLYDLRTWLLTGLHMHTKSLSFMDHYQRLLLPSHSSLPYHVLGNVRW